MSATNLIFALGMMLKTISYSSLSEEELHALDSAAGIKVARGLLAAYLTVPTEEGSLGRLLKACCKEMVVPAVGQLRRILEPWSKELKTVKGTREIHVQFFDHTVGVTHRQRNVCILLETELSLTLDWELSFTFNGSLDQMVSVAPHLLEFSWTGQAQSGLQNTILEALSMWIDEETIERTESSIPVRTAMRFLSQVLAKLPPEKELVTVPDLPGGHISAVHLLDLLSTTLLDDDFPPITCHKVNQTREQSNIPL